VQRQITKNDFDNWWNSPVAREFRKMLQEDEVKLSRGTMTEAFCRDHIGNAFQAGKYERTREILQLTYEDLA
jgi:hypothetical protein